MFNLVDLWNRFKASTSLSRRYI